MNQNGTICGRGRGKVTGPPLPSIDGRLAHWSGAATPRRSPETRGGCRCSPEQWRSIGLMRVFVAPRGHLIGFALLIVPRGCPAPLIERRCFRSRFAIGHGVLHAFTTLGMRHGIRRRPHRGDRKNHRKNLMAEGQRAQRRWGFFFSLGPLRLYRLRTCAAVSRDRDPRLPQPGNVSGGGGFHCSSVPRVTRWDPAPACRGNVSFLI